MRLIALPERSGSAAENMARDLLLLQEFKPAEALRFRHYGWVEPAFTFGLSQDIAYVRAQLPAGRLDLCRRPSGGGVVDHREDWTYGLVAPRGHGWCEGDAREAYRVVHDALARALRAQGEDVVLQPPPEGELAAGRAPSVCFQRAEAHDVVRADDGRKVAGAAQKRNKRGLLMQGSIERRAVGAGVDWARFGEDFVALLAEAAGAQVERGPWPEFPEEIERQLVEHYSSPEWLERR